MSECVEIDERIPPGTGESGYDYEALPYVYQAGEQLVVYRVNAYISMRIQCVARTTVGQRCDAQLPTCGYIAIHIVGTDADVEARISPWPPDCIVRQRCPAHVDSDCEDADAPSGELFDPVLHADTLFYTVPRWSPRGVWTPPEHKGRLRLRLHHGRDCPSGDHVPLAPLEDDEEDDEDWDKVPADQLIWDDNAPSGERTNLPPTGPPPTAEDITSSTALYRYFDSGDLLLYIGISDRLRTRTSDHIKGSSWMDFAVRSTIERLRSRDEALAAEEAAIKAERPIFNHAHNNSPEAQSRLVEYLVARGRFDLLAPAVSRG